MEEAQVPVPQSVAVAAATVAAATVAALVEAQAAVAALEDPLGIHSLAAPEVVVDSEAVPETRPRAFSRS
jgi:hypothetical protein